MAGTQNKEELMMLDGARRGSDVESEVAKLAELSLKEEEPKRVYKSFYSISKVGYVPFNPSKVNQDRACEVAPFGRAKDKAFFAVFDGHGQYGHNVSQYVASTLPKFILRQRDLDKTDPRSTVKALTAAFVACNHELVVGPIDCSYSGSTAVALFIDGNTLFCCNTGDSRAVLASTRPIDPADARAPATTAPASGLTVIPLSIDHKPDRPDEKRRILQSGGRVEACRAANGAEIGPPRVWLARQDVPGLAMTRSFGDQVAASVGVNAVPEVYHRVLGEGDRFLILASDGVWEFITNEEAVDMVAACKTAQEACAVLVQEAELRWRREEDVVDDISAMAIFL
jgi:serine/threonine protein phosphatase PrpC